MKTKIAIVGGGIVGATTAYYLSRFYGWHDWDVTMFDSGRGQATKAAAGIISPWLTKRRNQQWYHLARTGAALLVKLARKTHMPTDVYNQSGTIITRNGSDKVEALFKLAEQRKQMAPTMGTVKKLTSAKIKRTIPMLQHSLPGIWVGGGARVNGRYLAQFLINLAKQRNLTVVHQPIRLTGENQIQVGLQRQNFDWIVVAAGAWIKQVLRPLGIIADVRPQKGQLIVVDTHQKVFHSLPVLSPEGEYDFLPESNGRLVIGATHEDEKGFDLEPSSPDSVRLLKTAQHLVGQFTLQDIVEVRTGTRGYTSDYGPFFGQVPDHPHLLVGGGLGSSGLTTGPVIGKFLAQIIAPSENFSDYNYYEKPIEKYFKNEDARK